MKIKRGSWLYKLAVGHPSSRKEWHADNLCAIGRAMLWRSLGYVVGALAIVAGATLACFLVADFIAWLAAMVAVQVWIDAGPGGLVVAGVVCAAAIFGFVFGAVTLIDSIKQRPSKPGIATAIYGAVTGKFCTKIEYVD